MFSISVPVRLKNSCMTGVVILRFSFFNRPRIQRIRISSVCFLNSTTLPVFCAALYIFERLSISSSTKTRQVLSGSSGRYAASSSQEFLKKPLFSIKISLRSAKNGSVSARSIMALGLVSFPSNDEKFIVSSEATNACFNFRLY